MSTASLAATATVRELRARAVRVPMPEPHRTASGVIAESPLVLVDPVTGWDEPDDLSIARAQGAAWINGLASACLFVPSVPGRPYDRNIVVNTVHPDFAKLAWEPAEDVPWDPRLFS